MRGWIALVLCTLMIVLPLADALEISDVAFTDVTERSAKLKFSTDEQTIADIWWGANSSNLKSVKTTSELSQNYSVDFKGLKNSTTYYASIRAKTAENVVTANNSGKYYSFTTLAADTVPPYINVSLPAWHSKQKIDVYGYVEPDSEVVGYVNGELNRRKLTETGYFIFSDVTLEPEKINKIKLVATDHAGNKNEKEWDISVDVVRPVLSMNFSDFYDKNPAQMRGTVSEPVTLDVIDVGRNDTVISSSAVSGTFTASITLKEGENNLEFVARDKANNTDSAPAVIYLDTMPPTITDVSPAPGRSFYEGREKITITGKTKPLITVKVYYGSAPESMKTTKSDANGTFEFKGVDLSEYFRVGTYVETPSATQQQLNQNLGGAPLPDRIVDLRLVATDRAGLKVETPIKYRLITCYSGGDWNVLNLPEYQSPALLSIDRLESGTELSSFVLKLTYQGLGKSAAVSDIQIDTKSLCASESAKKDPKYNLSCKILSMASITYRPNPDRTMWYVRFDNLRMTEANMTPKTFSADWWKSFGKDIELPLKVTVIYTETGSYNLTKISKQQVKCMPIAYQIDMSSIKPGDVLPEWLLDASISGFNKTVEFINKIEPTFKKIVDIVGIGCMIAWGAKAVSGVARRIVCFWGYMSDKASATKENAGEKCPSVKDQNFLENTGPLSLDQRCPNCYGAWKWEAKTYYAYRAVCDRFLGHSAPASLTAGINTDVLTTMVQKSLLCNSEQTAGIAVQRVSGKECADCVGGGRQCYRYKDNYYGWDKQPAQTSGAKKGLFKLVKCAGQIIVTTTSKDNELWVTLDASERAFLANEDNPLITGVNCKTFCPRMGWETGNEVPRPTGTTMVGENTYTTEQLIGQQLPGATDYWYLYTATNDGYMPEEKGSTNLCKCSSSEQRTLTKDELGNQNIGKECQEVDKCKGTATTQGTGWDYRYSQTGYYKYDRFRYYTNRDVMACFGQDDLISNNKIMLDPSGFVNSFQCLYVTGIYNRMKLIKNIFEGMRSCFIQIKTTGKGNAGVCRELLSQYLCNLVSEAVASFINDCSPLSGVLGENVAYEYIVGTLKVGMTGAFQEASSFSSEYSNTAVNNFLEGGEGAVAKKVCLGALTGDWGISFQDVIDAGYNVPLATSAGAFPADRTFLTYNPETFNSVYNYNVAWMIAPGCNIESYRVDLASITRKEMLGPGGVSESFSLNNGIQCQLTGDKKNPKGCDCLDKPNILGEQTVNLFQGGQLSQNQFVTNSKNANFESKYRFDHVKITLVIRDVQQAAKCFPEANRQGNIAVFYSPIKDRTAQDIADCRFDQSTGEFKCSTSDTWWGSRGVAEIESYTPQPNTQFFPGDPITATARVWNQGGEKCLYGRVLDGNGMVVSGGVGSLDGWVWKTVSGDRIANDYPLSLVANIPQPTAASSGNIQAPSSPAGATLIVTQMAQLRNAQDVIVLYKPALACRTGTCKGTADDWVIDIIGTENTNKAAKVTLMPDDPDAVNVKAKLCPFIGGATVCTDNDKMIKNYNWLIKIGDATVGKIGAFTPTAISGAGGTPTLPPQISFTVKFIIGEAVGKQQWSVRLQLRYPNNMTYNTDVCANAQEADIVRYNDVQDKPIPISIVSRDRTTAEECQSNVCSVLLGQNESRALNIQGVDVTTKVTYVDDTRTTVSVNGGNVKTLDKNQATFFSSSGTANNIKITYEKFISNKGGLRVEWNGPLPCAINNKLTSDCWCKGDGKVCEIATNNIYCLESGCSATPAAQAAPAPQSSAPAPAAPAVPAATAAPAAETPITPPPTESAPAAVPPVADAPSVVTHSNLLTCPTAATSTEQCICGNKVCEPGYVCSQTSTFKNLKRIYISNCIAESEYR